MKTLSVVLENLHLLGNSIRPVGLIDKANVFWSFFNSWIVRMRKSEL